MLNTRIAKSKPAREVFGHDEQADPWDRLEAKIPPSFAGKRGRQPKGIILMLKTYLPQIWFNLADEGVEEQVWDSYAMRKFMGIDFTEEGAPDATTLPGFRHLLEKHSLQKMIFDTVGETQ